MYNFFFNSLDSKTIALIELLISNNQHDLIVAWVVELFNTYEFAQECSEFNCTTEDILSAVHELFGE